jgi:hypothetical protein
MIKLFLYLAETTVYRTKQSNEASNKGQTAFYRNVILPSKSYKEKHKVRTEIYQIFLFVYSLSFF